MKLAIGCDETAFGLKESVCLHLAQMHPALELHDFGTRSAAETALYPDVALRVATAIAAGEFDRAILLCGTGIGMAICANKVAGVRAAVCHDGYSAERARRSNDAQIMCLGARVIGAELGKHLVDIWLDAEFEGGHSLQKLARIQAHERDASSAR
ncbi:MAG TPA: ribose 5-phosphate isomerase B [Stenotrophomonas sp.]|nr:ribose 5-phosphate isomerase B [Stenotrophomonas sp.]